MTPKIIIGTNEDKVARATADYFLETAVISVKNNGRFVVAFSGGETPKKLFGLLSGDYFISRIPWLDTYVFWADERCVPPQHPDSNYGMAKTLLFSKVPLPQAHLFPMPVEMKPVEAAAKAYQSTLKSFFKIDLSLPKFNLILLGVGEDGHTASLFPGTPAVVEKERWVVANYVKTLPANRLTLTLPVINNAERVVISAPGERKASVVQEIFNPMMPANRYPVQYVNPSSGDVTWFLDTKAASNLPVDALQSARVI